MANRVSASQSRSVDEQWSALTRDYGLLVKTLSLCGPRGQEQIDRAYGRLNAFAKQHPKCQKELPRRFKVVDAGDELCFASAFVECWLNTISKT